MLFDDLQRTNGNPSEDGESLYAFLNRAAGEQWQSVRGILTEWLSHYPVDEQSILISRFRNTDERGFLGAFWELYLHELFRRLSFEIELHPAVVASTHRPDFRLRQGKAVIYVEAITIYERPLHSTDDARLAPVLDVVNRISSTRFLVTVDARQIASTALPLERLSRELGSWLDTLETESASRPARIPGSVFRWQEDGWMLIFRPIRRGEATKGTKDRPNLGTGPIRTRKADDSRVIRQRLSGKSRMYGRQFDEPFLIALTSYRPGHGPEAMLRGLLGHAWAHPEMIRTREIRRSRSTSPNGLWLTNRGVQYQDISAVLTAFDIMPWSIGRSQPWLIVNPWASHPLEIELPFNRLNIDPATGEIEQVETGFEPHKHFGLDSPNSPNKIKQGD